jgi:ribosomal-protein-alanine N-acetyltransferase
LRYAELMPVTERLIRRDTRMSEVPSLFAFLGDKGAMQHTHCCASLRDCRRHVAGHEWQWRKIGFAPSTIARKTDDTIISWGGLYDDPFDRGWGIEVGYWFARSAWGKGFASELVNASLAYTRECGVARVSAFARPKNVASCRVLEKAGFEKERFVEAMAHNLYCCRLA